MRKRKAVLSKGEYEMSLPKRRILNERIVNLSECLEYLQQPYNDLGCVCPIAGDYHERVVKNVR